MTWEEDLWAVDDARVSGVLMRRVLQAALRGEHGVLGAGDCTVKALGTPGGSARVTPGGISIEGVEVAGQGMYAGLNTGDDIVPISPTGGAGRSDMVIARVEDPTVDGTPWTHDPHDDQLIYSRVIQGVSSTATTVPAGMSAEPLARIDIPAGTSVITQAMITSLRVVASPKEKREVRLQKGVSPTDYAGNIVNPNFEDWPDLTWQVPVPKWATQVQVQARWSNAYYASANGNGDAKGRMRIKLNVGATEVVTSNAAYNFNIDTGNPQRVSMECDDQVSIPAALRGQTATLRMQVSGEVGYVGRLAADAWFNAVTDLQFLEIPVADIDA